MRLCWISSLVLITLVPACSSQNSTEGEKPFPHQNGIFTIGKDTTYLTEPLDKDGYVDYVAALNQHHRQGVTASNNAAVLLWRASGLDRDAKERSPEFFQLLSTEPPADPGEFFVDLDTYAKKQFRIDLADFDRRKEIDDHLGRATEWPWQASDYRDIASWLKANDKALALAVEASKRPRYFCPLVVRAQTKDASSGLFGSRSLVPGMNATRGLARALVCRAMLRIGEGDRGAACHDLLACHRLGRLLSQNGSMMTDLVGMALESMACFGELAYLNALGPDAAVVEQSLHDLQKLPARSDLAEAIDLDGRCELLDAVSMSARFGIEHFERGFRLWLFVTEKGPLESSNRSKAFAKPIPRDADWNIAMQDVNRWHDRWVAVVREKRKRQRDQMMADLKALEVKVAKNWDATIELLCEKKQSAEARGKVIAELFISAMDGGISLFHQALERCQQTNENLILAFALARYQRDHGRYPEKLAQLAPKYLPDVPLDRFSGNELIYRPTEGGYLLYSVGVNRKDDGGQQSITDNPPGDDLTVRMPLPRLHGR